MTLDDGFGNTRETCGEDCRMQIVRPGKIECEMCDGNPRIAHLEARNELLQEKWLDVSRSRASLQSMSNELLDGYTARITKLEEELAQWKSAWAKTSSIVPKFDLGVFVRTEVIVNGRPIVVTHTSDTITYEDIVKMSDENWGNPTVTYRRANQKESEGTTWPGGPDVRIKDGTIFNVIHTGNA